MEDYSNFRPVGSLLGKRGSNSNTRAVLARW